MTAERKFISENMRRVLLREYIQREIERAGFGGLNIQRTPLGTRVVIYTEKPGMVIGRGGETIKHLTDIVGKKFAFDNPLIEVAEIKNPNLNPHIVAQRLAEALERGWNFRRAGHSTVQRIMGAGAKGCQVIISGKLTGERHKTAKFTLGHIKYCGEPAKTCMEEGYAVALTKPGIMGVKIKIMTQDAKLPDEILIHPPTEEIPEQLPSAPPVTIPVAATAVAQKPEMEKEAKFKKETIQRIKKKIKGGELPEAVIEEIRGEEKKDENEGNKRDAI